VIVFFRLSLGFLVVAGLLAATRRLALVRLRERGVLLVVSGVVLAVHWAALFEAYKRIDVATTILIVFLGPVLFAAGAPFVLGERLRPLSVGALGLAFGGIALIAVPNIGEIDAGGLMFAFISAVLFGVLMLMGKLLTQHYEPAAITFWQLAVASIVMAPALFGADPAAIVDAAPGLLLLGGVYSGVLGIVFFHAVRALQAQQLGVLFYLEPASAVLYAWWWLGETPSATTLLGGALIVAAGLAIIVGDRRLEAVGSPEVST
jgi:drug/metabolite transporter (DMT)-like permease